MSEEISTNPPVIADDTSAYKKSGVLRGIGRGIAEGLPFSRLRGAGDENEAGNAGRFPI